ncbi:MAG: hypothetical protein JSS20_08245, partial [Proteobacteria bacterium]|nr:hypothetical protein [Pseudomonadota bacterium]
DPVTDAKEAELAKAASHTGLPGMNYTGPQGAGLMERAGVAAKQVGLDMLTTDQSKQADFLVKHFTPERGYMFVPVGNHKVMLIHEDQQTGAITRQLITGSGITPADLVHAAPQVGAAMLTGGSTAALTLPARAAIMGLVGGTVGAGSEGALKLAGSERDIDYGRIAADTAAGVLGEGAASALRTLVRTNGTVRNFIEDAITRRGQAPTMTAELSQTLQRAGIDPARFQNMTAELQKQVSRPLVAAEQRATAVGAPRTGAGIGNATRQEAANAVDTAQQTARNVVEAANTKTANGLRPGEDPGVQINAFEATPDPNAKAVFADALRGDLGPRAQRQAQALQARSLGDPARPMPGTVAGAERAAQEDIAAVNAGMMQQTPQEALDQSAMALRSAGADAKSRAAALVSRADADPIYRGDFTPNGLSDLQSRVTIAIGRERYGSDPNFIPAPVSRANDLVENWITSPHGDTSSEALRSSLRSVWNEAKGSDRRVVGNIIDQFDEWQRAMANSPSGINSGAAAKLQAIERGREAYARYVGRYAEDRPAGRLFNAPTNGQAIGDFVEGMRTSPERTIQGLIGTDGRMTPSRIDNLGSLVRQMEQHVAVPDPSRAATRGGIHTAPAGNGGTGFTQEAQNVRIAWDGLRQAIWLQRLQHPEAFESIGARDTMGRLFTPSENVIARQLTKIRSMIEAAGERTPGAQEGSKVLDGTRDLAKLIYRYRAVRELHSHGPVMALSQVLAGLTAIRGVSLLERFTSGLLMRGAENPMRPVARAIAPVGAAERLTGNQIVSLIRDAVGQNPSERESILIGRLQGAIGSDELR